MPYRNPKAVACVVAALLISCAGPAGAEQPRTLAYDGFNTAAGAGSYRNHIRLVRSAPTRGTVGFDAENYWVGNSSHVHARDRNTRDLSHSLVASTQAGSLGHWTFNGHRAFGRKLSKAPVAASGVYTLCILYRANDHHVPNEQAEGKHTTNFAGAYAMIGFTPVSPPINLLTARGGTNGACGLSIGYYEDDLRVFAGGKSFNVVEGYKEDTTYLLIAEMTVSAEGPEFIRAFHAVDGEKGLTPAKFNEENGGKGVQVETWASPEDMIELEIYLKDATGLGYPHCQASINDKYKRDYISWDEVRLLDGRAVVPIVADPAEKAVVAEQAQDVTLTAAKTLPPKLVAYWPFDEADSDKANDAVGGAHGNLLRVERIEDGSRGKAMHFATKIGPKYGPHSSSMVSVPHETAVKAGFPWERHHQFTFSAWIRGASDFKGKSDIVTKAHSGLAPERRFADIKGIAFFVCKNKLQLDLVNSVNYPQADNRLTVRSNLDVPGDNKWHHVAVTYDGSSRSKGVVFYVDGVKNEGLSLDFENVPGVKHLLTADIGTLSPYCIGGRDCLKPQNPVTALAADYAMSGDIDEVGIFSYALSGPYVVAIHSLAAEKDLGYALSDASKLIELHKAKAGAVKIGDRTWEYVGSALAGGVGKVQKQDGKFLLQLADDGSGVRTK